MERNIQKNYKTSLSLEEKINFELSLYENKDPSIDRILDKLFLGNYAAALNKNILLENNIKFILIASNNMEMLFKEDLGIEYKKIPINDSKKTNISKYFKESNDFIDNALSSNKGNILIHCGAGASRSVSLLIAFMIYKFSYTFDQSLEIIQKIRNVANPNDGFKRQLEDYSYILKNPL